ncbi:hypothetical protein ACFE04_021872 [Oxalis oulophora]
MDPSSSSSSSSSNNYPLVCYVLHQVDPNTNPPLPPHIHQSLTTQLPHLTNPKLISSLTQSIPTTTTHTLSLFRSLGSRPDPDSLSLARSNLQQQPDSSNDVYTAVVKLEEMYEKIDKELSDVEVMLGRVYGSVVESEINDNNNDIDEEVVRVLKESESESVSESGVVDTSVNLSNRQLRFLPEAFGKLQHLLNLNLSRNQFEFIPDSIAGLHKLQVLDVSYNMLKSLPDSIGLLTNLKTLYVAGNKLTALPDSIVGCSSLVELDASFNDLLILPTNIGYGLPNLQKLSIQLNKIRLLPSSICEMKSLKYIDVHFNELLGLPLAIGRLTNLETLNASNNFGDFTTLPETICDLTNLKELDLSNNQIKYLPDGFGWLENLSKLNLEENPIVVPPVEIVKKGAEAVKEFMKARWISIVAEQQQVEASRQQAQSGWLAWGSSMIGNVVSGVSQTVGGYLGGGKVNDPYLDQQL